VKRNDAVKTPLPTFLLLLVLLTALGCPLDIQVRPEAGTDAGCQGEDCARACTRDLDCPDGQRCDDFYDVCEPGSRLTEECSGFGTCPAYADCKNSRCEQRCTFGCPLGYQCGPESLCVEQCTAGPPETLGRFCASSLDCTRCGFCVESGDGKKCHQPCGGDADCPGGGAGACQLVPGGSLRVCRLL
jgi:hypothetical protein